MSSYPTVLLFTPTTLDAPTPISGILDSAHLLSTLGQAKEKKQSHSSLVSREAAERQRQTERERLIYVFYRVLQVELTPESLPALLPELSATLVLWCDGEVNSDKAAAFREQASHAHHTDLTFTWMNRYAYRNMRDTNTCGLYDCHTSHSDKHLHLLSHIVPTSANYPAVVAINFKKVPY